MARIVSRASFVLLVVASIYAATGWIWRTAFIWGEIGGIYWLFALIDRTALLFAASVLLLAGIVRLVRNRRVDEQPFSDLLRRSSRMLFLASFALCAASVSAIFGSAHLDTIAVDGRRYHLAAIHAFPDVNYGLYECDGLGLICRQMYRSGDYFPYEAVGTRFVYDAPTTSLRIQAANGTTVYAYPLR
jgi:hypothetical protein